MRNIFYFLLLLNLAVTAQTENFTIQEDKNIIWQKIYKDSSDINIVTKNLKLSGNFETVTSENDITTFYFKFNPDNFKQFGYDYYSEALFTKYGGECKGTIEYKENAYRVTIFDIRVLDALSGKNLEPVYYYFLTSDGKFKTNKRFIRSYTYFDSYFDLIFKPKKIKSDW